MKMLQGHGPVLRMSQIVFPGNLCISASLPIISPGDRYPHRDEVIQYLKEYASHLLRRVENVSKESDYFRVENSAGKKYFAWKLIFATDSYSRPFMPLINKQDEFTGSILHSVTHSTPASFQDQKVVVIGRGNSTVQIAMELSGVADTKLAVRESVALIPHRLLEQDIHFCPFYLFPVGVALHITIRQIKKACRL